MRPVSRALFAAAALLASLSAAASVRAEPRGKPDFDAIFASVVEKFAKPRTTAFAEAADTEAKVWTAFCASARKPSEIEGLKAAFARTADAWVAIEVLRSGPAAQANRYERLVHWPERRNAIGRGLAQLYAGTNPADLEPAAFAKTSVAVQGLNAMERVLFEPDATKALAAPGPAGQRRCAVGSAIATAIAATAGELRDGWGRDPKAIAAETGASEPGREATTRILTDLLTEYRAIIEVKIDQPAGKSLEQAKPATAEMARSQRSTRTIVLALDALDALTRLLIDPDWAEADSVLATVASARSIAATEPGEIGPLAADPKTRSRVVLLRSAVDSAYETAVEAVPAALGLTVGFTSLDGD
ncbi:hypothetical protein ABB55_25125 [Prosthecomicrobium hirschii]|uniref:Imelysin-like domain-containing protein n=1 Tax=Prosthecodimorpha hirschii TaxID=665126 RepID=A0A0P6W7I8_9HYPH|nr:imelysin family protein [Prosthecomicrobium hirschii]KPL55104.1 hypothetical protein ABB55_25125 [Prosthecomicrobium hirschii]